MVKITSGKILDALKSVLRLIDKGLDALSRLGMEVKDKETLDDGSVVYTIYAGDNDSIVFKVRVSESKDSSRVTVECRDDTRGKKAKYEDVDPNKIEDTVQKFCEHAYGVDAFTMESDVDSSSKFRVGLTRVAGSKTDSVKLTAVCCNQNISCSDMFSDIEDMLTDSDVLDSLPENKTTYFELDHQPDCVEVVETNSCPPTENPYLVLVDACYAGWNASFAVEFNGVGIDSLKLSDRARDVRFNMEEAMLQFSRLCVESTGSVPTPMSIMSHTMYSDIDTTKGFSYTSGIQVLINSYKEFISALELVYCEVTHDVKPLLDSWIRESKDYLNRFLERTIQ